MFVVLMGTLAAVGAQRSTPPGQAAREEIDRLVAASGAEVAVAWQPLSGGPERLLINSTMVFHAASTMKVPVMIELFRVAGTGRLKLNDMLNVTNQFHSIVDGRPFQHSV